jgi:hypothetical protein
MTRALGSLLAIGLGLGIALGGTAHADPPDALEVPETPAPSSVEVTRLLPNTTSAVVGTTPALTAAWAGYDGAAQTPVMSLGTEVRLVRRLAIVAGVAYGNAHASDAGLRPQLGVRLQVLQQRASGVDASAAFTFREDRFTAEDGLFQGELAIGRSFGETSTVVNVLYAQDGEGDDHEGELRLAAVRRVWRGLHVGAEGRYMHSLASTDPHRDALGTPSMEAMAGPVLAYRTGSWGFLAEVGVSMRQTNRLDTGLATLGGIGTTF